MNALSLEVQDSLAVLTADQPGSKVNVLSRAVWSELGEAVRELRGRPGIRGLILESGKPGIFIAGADLKDLADVPAPDHPPTREFIEQGLRVLVALEDLPFPTAACIDGAALGGGLEVALACDYRLAGTSPRTRLGLPEVTLGLIPGWGGTQRLPRLVGIITALEQILGNVQFDADTAHDRGLIDAIAPSESMRAEAARLLLSSADSGEWRERRERKRRPVAAGRADVTIEDLKEGNVTKARLDAMSFGPETMAGFRQSVNERTAECRRPAALAAIDVIERGCALPLREAIPLETAAFLRLAASPEARQIIAEFFARKK
jgi:enoyl-CoA hydratase/carnithine racemase